MTENRHAIEQLMTAFERLAEQAGAKGWPTQLVADACFRSGVMLAMAHHGVPQTANHCRHLASELDHLSALLDAKAERAA